MAAATAEVTEYMLGAEVDDRLAGSYAYTNMMAVATAGWLMSKQLRAAQAEIANGDTSAFLQMAVIFMLQGSALLFFVKKPLYTRHPVLNAICPRSHSGD